MSNRSLLYYFTLQSPWSYLGHAAFMAVAARNETEVVWRPVNLVAVFPESGGLPLARRHPKRQAYRDIELQRWRLKRDIALNLRPAFWPLDVGLADRTVIALAEHGENPDRFVRAAFGGIWAEDRNLADPAVIGRCLGEAGSDPAILDLARSPGVADLYARYTAEALGLGVFGAPTYVLDGEPFWGQDRIGLLDEALASGRPAFRP